MFETVFGKTATGEALHRFRVFVKADIDTRCTRWCSSLRYRATSRKVAGSIPDCVTGILLWHYPSGFTMVQGSTQEYFLGGKGGRCVGQTVSPSSCAGCVEIWEPQTPTALRAVQVLLFYDIDTHCLLWIPSLLLQFQKAYSPYYAGKEPVPLA